MKRCSRCRKEKPVESFGLHTVDPKHPDGLRTMCQQCWREICWATS